MANPEELAGDGRISVSGADSTIIHYVL